MVLLLFDSAPLADTGLRNLEFCENACSFLEIELCEIKGRWPAGGYAGAQQGRAIARPAVVNDVFVRMWLGD